MKTVAPRLGICKSVKCNLAGNGPVEIYDGPGKYCPDCGELLQSYNGVLPAPASKPEPAPAAAAPEASAASAAPSPAEVPPRADDRVATLGRALTTRRAAVIASAVAVVALIIGAVVFVMGGKNAPPPATVGVCGSSITDHVAHDLLVAYLGRNPAAASHFTLRAENCDVRFFTALAGPGSANPAFSQKFAAAGSVVAHDALVAIVNPQNPLTQLSLDQLRDILTGTTTSWSGLHGPSGPIDVYVPADTSDESHIASMAILHGAPLGSSVTRVATSADVVRAVAAANGRNRIGIVAFSQAVPGKVLALQSFPAPSIVSIGNGQYPLALGVAVNAWQVHDRFVPGLLAFAASDGAKAVVARDGLLP
jgi:hypothetical protein